MFVDKQKALKELQCYMYCLYESLENFKNKNYGHAAVYLENAARSLKALEELRVEDESNHVVNIFVISRDNDGYN